MSQKSGEDAGWTPVERKKERGVQLIRNSYTVILAGSFAPHYAPSLAEARQISTERGGDYGARGETNTVLQGASATIIAVIGGQPRDNIVRGESNRFTLVLTMSRWIVRMRVAGSDARYEVISTDSGIGEVTIKGYIESAGSDPLPKLRVTGIEQ